VTRLDAVSRDGTPVHAVDEGSGPTILIVHGGSSDLDSWKTVGDLLVDEYRVVRLQRRIYAAGASIALPHRMATEADDVAAVAAGLGTPLVVGHSSGAVAVLEAAVGAPRAFSALALYEPPLPTTTLVGGEAVVRARAAVDRGDTVEAMKIHMRDIVRMPAALVDAMFTLPEAQAEFARYAAAQIADDEAIDALGVGIERYRKLDLPTLLIEGDQSPDHLRRRLADLAEALPNVAEIVTLNGQGHVANLTDPEHLAGAIRSFAHRTVS
jgi:pimeloyl-ACP methyl ester carboxylesterase